jgi:hypothetical protein
MYILRALPPCKVQHYILRALPSCKVQHYVLRYFQKVIKTQKFNYCFIYNSIVLLLCLLARRLSKSFLQKFGNHYKISISVGRPVVRSPLGARTFLFAQTRLHRPWGPPNLFQMVSGLFPGEGGRGVALTTHRLLASRLKKE